MFIVTQNLSFFLFAFSTLLVSLYFFTEGFKYRSKLSTLKGIGFFLLSIASFMNLSASSFSDITLRIMEIAYFSFFLGIVFDKHSGLRYSLFIPLFGLFLAQYAHRLLFLITTFILIAILELAYHTEHKKMLPFIVAFTCLALGEYFYSLETFNNGQVPILNGYFLYIFASLIFTLWVTFYILRKLKRIVTNTEPIENNPD